MENIVQFCFVNLRTVAIRMSSQKVLTMSDYIRTYTGIRFYPLEPDPAQIEIRDIAHALPMICRGNGHVSGYFSVGQHCLNCSREAELCGLPVRIQLACLLHDAGECYLSDVPRPFKKQIPSYSSYEERILSMIYEKYLGSDLTSEEKKLVIRPAGEDEKDAFLWCSIKNAVRRPKQITCRVFFAKIVHLMSWNADYRYKLLGKIIRSGDEKLAVFDLNATEIYVRTAKEG